MTITKISELRDNYFSRDIRLEWVNPQEITCTDPKKTKMFNWGFLGDSSCNIGGDSDDETIVEYLDLCLQQNSAQITAKEFVRSVVYLIDTYWSIDATVRLAHWTNLLTKENVNECVSFVKNEFENSEAWPVKALIRNFSVDFFRDSAITNRECLSPENASFIDFLIADRNHIYSSPPKSLDISEILP